MVRTATRPPASPFLRGIRAIRGAFVGGASRVVALFALTHGRWRLFRHDVDGAVASLDARERESLLALLGKVADRVREEVDGVESATPPRRR